MKEMNSDTKYYEEPKKIQSIDECYFYHTIELPKYGLMEGQWDLRDGIDAYVGHIDVSGKRFLDIGTASGYVCFEMEKRGAEVVAYDLSENDEGDIVPWGGTVDVGAMMQRKQNMKKVNNGFWLAHELFQSHAKVVHGSVYDIPAAIGPFEISFFGSILLHVRDPFLALQRAAAITKETMVVTDVVPPGFIGYDRTIRSRIKSAIQICVYHVKEYLKIEPIVFAPDPRTKQPSTLWWYFSPKAIATFLKVLGFGDISISYHYQKFIAHHTNILLFTVVGRKL